MSTAAIAPVAPLPRSTSRIAAVPPPGRVTAPDGHDPASDPGPAVRAASPSARLGAPLLRLVSDGQPPAAGSGYRATPVRRPRPVPSPRVVDHAALARRDERDRRLVGSTARVILEVLQRRRSARQLAELMDPDPVALVESWSHATGWSGARVVSVRAQRPAGHAVEGCARIEVAGHSLMVAIRLQASGPRWRGVRLDLIGTPGHLALLGGPR